VASDYNKYATKTLDSGPNDNISRLSVPEFPGKCYVKQAMSCALLQKGRAYINIEMGRAFLLAQYQNKECCKYFCASFISVNSSCFHVRRVLCLSPIS
jgi:hypothetical protein